MSDSKQEVTQDQKTTPSRQAVKKAERILLKAIKANDLVRVKELVESKTANITYSVLFHSVGEMTATILENQAVLEYLFEKADPQLLKAHCDAHELSKHVALEAPWPPREKEKFLKTLVRQFRAAVLGDLETLKDCKPSELVAKDRYHRSLMHYAAANGQLEVLKWLREQKVADINAGDRFSPEKTALSLAVRNGRLETVKWFFENVKIDRKSRTEMLLLAAKYDRLEIIKFLLSKEGGATIDDRDRDGITAFLAAAKEGHLRTVKWLFENGAKINERDVNKHTAFLWAATYDHLETVRYLLENGAKIGECDLFETTALFTAIINEYEELAKILISEYGANQETQGTNGKPITSSLQHYTDLSKDSVLRDPKILSEWYQSYFIKQKGEMTSAILTDLIPVKDLRGIVWQYHDMNPVEIKNLPQELKKAADKLLAPLKEHAEADVRKLYKHQDLSKSLFNKISCQNPCNELTIHRAVQAFLEVHGEKIKGSELAKILNGIIEQNPCFSKPKPVEPEVSAVKIIDSKGNAQPQQPASSSQTTFSEASEQEKLVADFARLKLNSAPSSKPKEEVVLGLEVMPTVANSSIN